MKTALLFFLSCTLSGSAASWYVRDGASGSGTTWTDAYDQLTSAETAAARGDTIYVADGTYTGVTFNTGNSGTFSLNLATTAGTTLSSPYDTDLTTATRGADGTWDRGAYEYAGGIIVSSKLSGTVVVSGGVTLR